MCQLHTVIEGLCSGHYPSSLVDVAQSWTTLHTERKQRHRPNDFSAAGRFDRPLNQLHSRLILPRRQLRQPGATAKAASPAGRKPTLLLEIRRAGRHSAKNLTRLLLKRGETRQRGHLTG